MTTIETGAWLEQARRTLTAASERPHSEVLALLSHVTGQPRSWLLAHSEETLAPELLNRLNDALQRLWAGEPLPYVLGEQEFYGLTFHVTPDVLIPRPETELLVDAALAWLREHPARRRAADVGTGSGCIALTLASHIPDLLVTASDISPAALSVAAHNRAAHGLTGRVALTQADLFEGAVVSFDLICANLPYIPTRQVDALDVARFEPRLALDGGAAGLEVIERLLAKLPIVLSPGGLALLEIEAGQGESALELARQYFPFADIHVQPDLAGHPRLLVIENSIISGAEKGMSTSTFDKPIHQPRRQDRAINDEAWIESLLHRAPVGMIATAVDNQPFIIANLFAYDPANRCIYFHTATKGRTIENIEVNPRVCFSVSEMGRLLPAGKAFSFSVEYNGVTVFGPARVVRDAVEAERGLKMLMDKYFPHLKYGQDYVGVTPEELEITGVLRIDIELWSGKQKAAPADFPGAFLYGEHDKD